MENNEEYSNEISEFEIKLKDKLFELHTKRKLLKELDGKVQKLEFDKHDYQRLVEKTKREMQEMSVHLEVAMSTARNSESERVSNRELMARQKIQYQTAVADRDNLQEQVRSLEIENVKLKRLLIQSDEKLIKQNIMQERCKNKENQLKKSIDQLESQIKQNGEYQHKIIEMFSVIHKASQRIVYYLKSKTDVIEKLEAENSNLQEKVLSLNEQLSMKQVNNSARNEELTEKIIEAELKVSLQVLENSLQEKDKEIDDLQKSVEMAFNSIKFLETKNSSLQNKILILQNEKICAEAKAAMEHKETDGGDILELIECKEKSEEVNLEEKQLNIQKA